MFRRRVLFFIARAISSFIRRRISNIAKRAIDKRRAALASRASAAARAELAEEAAELAAEVEQVIADAYVEALTTMAQMVGNSGQQTVFDRYIVPAFEKSFSSSDPEFGWQDVDVGKYMAFVGQIVEEGNRIMEEAFNEASSLLKG